MFGRRGNKRQASRAVTGEEGRRRFDPRPLAWVAATVMFAAALVWGGERLLQPEVLPLRSVQVEGAFHHVTPDEIRMVMKGFATAGFIHVDTEAVRREVEALPWVARATVVRLWPDRLRIVVKEQRAVALWGQDGLVSPDGRIFSPPPASYPSGLPFFQGPPGMQQTMVRRYGEMQRILAPLGFQVVRLELDARGAWRLGLDNGMALMLGRQEKSHERLLRFVRSYNRVLAARAEQIEQVDLRYTNGFAVRWKPAGDESKEMSNV